MSLNQEQREQFNHTAPSGQLTQRQDNGQEKAYPFHDWQPWQRLDYLDGWWDERQGKGPSPLQGKFYDLGRADARAYAGIENDAAV